MTCVCLDVAALTARRSTTLRGSPLFFPTTCILLHQVVGVLEGTRSNTPSCISRSNSSRTWSTQWARIFEGLWIATGSADFFTWIRRGGNPDILGSGWWEHVLNADAAYVFSIHFSNLGMFSGVNGKGGWVGGGGGSVCFKHPHDDSSLPSVSN